MSQTKTYHTVSSDALIDHLKRSQISVAAFAIKIGVSQGAVSKWIKTGNMPQYMGVMVNALEDRAMSTETSAFIVSGKHEAISVLLATAKQMQLQAIQIEL